MTRRALLLWVPLAGGCPAQHGAATTTDTAGDPATTANTSTPTTTGDEATTAGTTLDTEDTGEAACPGPGAMLDVLFVINNAYGSIPEQAQLTDGMPHLLARLRGLGGPIAPDVNIMFTTTDMDHPLCAVHQEPGYYPARGEPTASPCPQRLAHFADYFEPVAGEQVCTDRCPASQAAAPRDPFIHFDADGHNIEDAAPGGDPVARALACLGPQGFVGCNYEAPLAAMSQALGPDKPWNRGERPFLRDCAALAVVIVSDETDCSVADAGYRYFDDRYAGDPEYGQYMEESPDQPGVKKPSSAVCWNGSMRCEDGDGDGVHASCVPEERGVLQPIARHVELLRGRDRPVFMLLLTGVPPTPGGVDDLVYRDWTDADLLPGEPFTAAQWQFSQGIGPGCTHPTVQHVIPPGRLQAVCEALDVADDARTPGDESRRRCCIESLCRDEYTGAFDCLADQLARDLGPGAAR